MGQPGETFEEMKKSVHSFTQSDYAWYDRFPSLNRWLKN